MFGGEELEQFIERADLGGGQRLRVGPAAAKNGLDRRLEITDQVKALVVTRGAEGSVIYTQERTWTIPCAKPKAVVDPTGCGDAYRAGLIHGLLHGLDWETTGRLASLMGAIKIESRGPQNHAFTRAGVAAALRREFWPST